MSDEMKKQELEESIEGVKPSIEVDTVNEEVVIEPATEEVAEEVMEKEKLAESEPEAPVEGEEVEGEVEGAEEQPVAEEADKSDEESADEEAQEEKSGEESDVPDETPVDSPDEAAELRAELESLKSEKEDAQMVNDFLDTVSAIENKLVEVQQNVSKGIEEVAKKYGIPTNISMEELEAQDPTKAKMAKEIMARAQAVIQQASTQLNIEKENKARDLVFKQAEKEFKKYELSQDQVQIAASTFVNIINQTGVQDLAEDLKAKVKLAVAQARMDSPVVAKVAEVAQEVLDDTDPSVLDTTVSNEPSPKIEEEVKPVEEVKDEVPPTPKKDLSEYMEGASTSVQKVATVTVDNVLQQLAALPFRERTAFYKEHQDIINQAMTMKRKDVE